MYFWLKNRAHRLIRWLTPVNHYSDSLTGSVAEQFHKIYYDNGCGERPTFGKNHWRGVPVAKIPFDLWTYQEIICETRPDLIIECGTSYGGSAYFFASICDLLNHGRVVTIDVETLPNRPEHPRITYLRGSSTDDKIVEQVKAMARSCQSVMVILDSDHSEDHVTKELKIYNSLVTKGNYLVVEDSNLNGHPVWPMHGPGPMEALEKFLKGNSQFQVDKARERHLVTFNPMGYLKRV